MFSQRIQFVFLYFEKDDVDNKFFFIGCCQEKFRTHQCKSIHQLSNKSYLFLEYQNLNFIYFQLKTRVSLKFVEESDQAF